MWVQEKREKKIRLAAEAEAEGLPIMEPSKKID
jgi:hypothetical protein